MSEALENSAVAEEQTDAAQPSLIGQESSDTQPVDVDTSTPEEPEVSVEGYSVENLSEEVKALKTIDKFVNEGTVDVNKVLESYANIESLSSKKVENLTDDEAKALYSKLGVPESPEGYEFEFEEGDAIGESYAKIAKELNVPKETAHKLHDWLQDEVGDVRAHIEQQFLSNNEKNLEALKEDLGAELKPRLDAADAAITRYGEEGLVDALTQAGLNTHPAVVKTFAKIGMMIEEDKAVGEKAHKFGISYEKTKDKIQELYKDKEYMARLSNPTHPKHAEAKEKRERLYMIAHGLKG